MDIEIRMTVNFEIVFEKKVHPSPNHLGEVWQLFLHAIRVLDNHLRVGLD